MGREIKHVPLNFAWPLNMPWKGFMRPYRSQRCKACEHTGYNPETKAISDDWYDFNGTGRKWCHAITQDEVQALVEAGRLYDFTHTFVRETGWVKKTPPVIPTAEEVNARFLSHDAINRSICIEARATRLGVWGVCPVCQGAGEIWFSEEIERLAEEWESYEPPAGPGWQLWETVSEGSPISPVFATKEEFIAYLVGQGNSEEDAKAFCESEWVPTMVTDATGVHVGIESAGLMASKKEASHGS